MSIRIRRVEYFHATVKDSVGAGYQLLSEFADEGVNFVAFNAVPIGPVNIQMVLFPEKPELLLRAAGKLGVVLTEPQQALLVQGDDRLGTLAEIHRKLFDNGINVYASSGVTSGEGSFGYVVYVKPEDFEKAANTLEL